MFQANDAPALKALARESILTSVQVNKEILTRIIDHTDKHIDTNITQTNGVFLKCVQKATQVSDGEKKEIRGFILIQDYWNLSDLFVAAAFHKQGIGKALWLHALSLWQKQPQRKDIHVNASANAEAFYKHLGFVDRETSNTTPNFIVPLKYQHNRS